MKKWYLVLFTDKERTDLYKVLECYTIKQVAYLLDMKPNYLENPSDDVDMGLDEMIWNLGLNLPSWDDELPNGDN